jgi:hypothetical protein
VWFEVESGFVKEPRFQAQKQKNELYAGTLPSRNASALLETSSVPHSSCEAPPQASKAESWSLHSEVGLGTS